MDASAEADLARTYLELYVDYRLTITGLYFTPPKDSQLPSPHAKIQTLYAVPPSLFPGQDQAQARASPQ